MPTTTPHAPTGAPMLGRAIDVILAAVESVGLAAGAVNTSIGHRCPTEIVLYLRIGATPMDARRVFAALGVASPALGPIFGRETRLASMSAKIPPLGVKLNITVTDGLEAPAVGDVESLIATVDAARATAEGDAQ